MWARQTNQSSSSSYEQPFIIWIWVETSEFAVELGKIEKKDVMENSYAMI